MPVDLGRFKRTLVYTRRAPIDALLEDLAALRAFDGKQEKLLTLLKISALIGVVCAVAAYFGWFSMPWLRAAVSDPAGLVIGLLVAFAIVCVVIVIVRSKYNLENRRYELAERALRFLRKDSHPEAEVALEIDFRRPNIKPKHVHTGQVRQWKVKYYTDPWLRVGGRLLDGTAYRLSAIEKHQDRSKVYRSSSGKMKSKSKTKSASELIVHLKVKTRRFPLLHALHGSAKEAREAVQLPQWVNLKACRIHAPKDSEVGTLLLRSATKQAWSCETKGQAESPTSGVRWFAMSFLSLYQVLNFGRGPEKA